jgi:hypothetical protein
MSRKPKEAHKPFIIFHCQEIADSRLAEEDRREELDVSYFIKKNIYSTFQHCYLQDAV